MADVFGTDGNDTLVGGDGNDNLSGLGGNDTLVGGAGNDVEDGGAGDDLLLGDEGDDQLTGGAGNDSIYGGTGSDTAILSGNRSDYTLTVLNNGDFRVRDNRPGSPNGTDLLGRSIEKVRFADQTLTIAAPSVDLTGTPDADILTGGDGNDNIFGAGGNDTIVGGGGFDSLSGGSGLDTLTGGLENDSIFGGDGDDRLDGGEGADFLQADAGDDVVIGGTGNDTLDGGTGIDTAIFSVSRSQATVTRNSDRTLTVGTGADGTDIAIKVEQYQFSDGLYSFQFDKPGAVLVSNFGVGAGGWSSQDRYPRHVADMNGDGYGDIVGFGHAGTFVSYGSAGGTFSAPGLVVANFGHTSGWTSDNQFHRELADLNGDGRADIVGFGIAGTWVSLAQANGSFSAPTIGVTNFGTNQGWTSQEGFARTVGDVNGDGRADIVGFGFAGTWLSLGKGDGTFADPKLTVDNFGVQQGWTSDNQFHRAVADIDGDGFDDIVGFGYAGTWAARSNGDGTFGQAYFASDNFGRAQGWSSQDAFSRDVADVNGDAIADIVGFGIAGTWIGYGQGDGTFSAVSRDVDAFTANQGWTSDNTYHRELADLNGDGLTDIVGFGHAGVFAGYNQGDWMV